MQVTKKIYIAVLFSLGALLLIDAFFPDHHHVSFPWHTVPGFDIFFGFVGCLALMIGSLALGELWLWKPTISVLATTQELGEDFEEGVVTKIHVDTRGHANKGDALADIQFGDTTKTILACTTGRVNQVYSGEGDTLRLGETLLNLQVTHETMDALHSQTEADHV